jgi:tRNA(adenine34) deaminase
MAKVISCDDPKTGAVKTLYNIVQDDRLNHTLKVTSGILADECSRQFQRFFQKRRKEKKEGLPEL